MGSEEMPGSHEHTVLFEAASSAAEEFINADIEPALIKEDRGASGIVRRQIYSVSARDGGRYILRGYRPVVSGLHYRLRSRKALWSQQHWLSFLADKAGAASLRPISTPEGFFVVERDVPGLDREGSVRPRLFIMQSLLPGSELNIWDLREEELSAIGASMARMHLASKAYEPPQEFTRPVWDWGEIFGDQLPLWSHGREYLSETEMKVFADASKIAWWELKALGTDGRVFGMIHRDLQTTNILFDRGLARIVDFDGSGWGYYLYDLALLLLAISHYHRGNSERSQALRQALVSGYETQAPLPFGYERYIDTFLIMRQVSRVSIVLQQALSRGDRSPPEYLSESLEILREYNRAREKSGRVSYLMQRAHLIARKAWGNRFFGTRNPALFIPAEFYSLL